MIRFPLIPILILTLTAASAFGQSVPSAAAGERTAVDLTIYNQNLSLIREERPFTVGKGLSRLIIPDVPATIDGTSLHFQSLTDSRAVRVLEQSYQYDLVSQAKLLEKYLGRTVEFIRVDPESKKEISVPGRLIASGFGGSGGLIAEINGKIELNPSGRIALPALSEGLILRPQLEWLVSNSHDGPQKAEISYLAGQLSWSCNYVALLNKDNTAMDLTGWVTLTNNSGTTFTNAGLKLVAGDVNLVRQAFAGMRKGMEAQMAEAAAPQFAQTELFEYKLYTLQRRTDVRNNETKQIELVTGRSVPAKKMFIYDGLSDQWRYWYNNYSYRSQSSFGQQSNTKVGVFVTFRNEEKTGLGIPLPKGTVRVYSRDDDGKEQFIGEDEIDHTPKDEEVRLYLGNAFDIVGERAQKDFRSYASGNVVEETIQVKVRNHKADAVDVQVYEHPWRWSQWDIVKSSTGWTKVDQSTLRFPVRIPKDGEAVVTYTVRYSW